MARNSSYTEIFEVEDNMSTARLINQSSDSAECSDDSQLDYGTHQSHPPGSHPSTHNSLQHQQTTPQQGFNSFLALLTFFSAIGGFLFGYDTGVVSGAMILLREEFKLSTVMQELIVSITIGAAALFAVIGGFMNEYMGRKPVIIIASFVFTCGAILLGVAVNTAMLIAGRAIIGVSIGEYGSCLPETISFNTINHLTEFFLHADRNVNKKIMLLW